MPKKKPIEKKASQAGSRPDADGSGGMTPKTPKARTFPIIGLGASAGGLEALKSFFSTVAENNGMAYIVVVHMSPRQPSMLPDLLQKGTPLPVLSAADGQVMAPDHIYVIPPDKDIAVYKGTLQLLDIVKTSVPHPIDSFLRSLAHDQGRYAAAVILSGTGTDGTLGVKEIKANDGLVLVQSEETAGYDGMPRSAIGTGLVDIVLPPQEMPPKLVQYFAHPETAPGRTPPGDFTGGMHEDWLNKIFAILRSQIGRDFSAYKVNTILRRISRRMGLNQIDSHDQYVRFLRESPGETEALFRELLIGVTNFFRDTESFDVLKADVFPGLFKQMKNDDSFRAWIPGCSTGEEVYSLAIILRECLDTLPKRINLQLFGTDIDDFAIDKAREGLYPATIAADVSKDRLKRFFTKEGDFFRIRKEIRDAVVFSMQDLIKDPPFSRLNLLCCRNLLIYLDTDIQKKLMPLFHYTLKPDGILVLGSSETIGGFTRLFKTQDKKWKIYRRLEVPHAQRQWVDFPSGISTAAPGPEPAPGALPGQKFSISQITQKAILDQFAPTAILIDAGGEILHVQGRTGKYLETPSGPPTQNILDLAREGLRIELSSAVRAAKASKERITRKQITVKTNGDGQTIDLHVCPQRSPKELAGRFLVVFEDIPGKPPASGPGRETRDVSLNEASGIAELEKELQTTRESHHTTIEELESSNEELKSTNEELQSANEELQSTNEELESSKEELQSLNEELQTVNAELQSKVEELSAAQDDMRNLMNGTEVATIFVDNDMRVRRFTREATRIVNFIQTDVGRPLEHVTTNLAYDGMKADLDGVLENLTPRETEVQTLDGRWFKMRIMPYRTTDNRIDGAVLTFSSIDAQKKAQEVLSASSREFEKAWALVRTIFDMHAEPMAVLDAKGKTVTGNTAFAELMKTTKEGVEGRDIFDPKEGIIDPKGMKKKLETALREGKSFKTEVLGMNASGSKQKFVIECRCLQMGDDFPYRVLLRFTKEP
ncbi:MAG: PAS domain-containing protein [Desulfobacterales bacterium]|nr:PAS domain-containing protein [Desulfobacterales bacterium]